MCRTQFVCAMLVGIFIVGSRSIAGDLVEGSDDRAKPMKQALAALIKEIDGGDFEKAKALYAGSGADLDLLKAYVDGVATAKTMRAAMQAKFGDHLKRPLAGLDSDVTRMAVCDFNSVIFLDDPDRASSSANSPLGVGIEFKRVGGDWKVLSLASAPDSAEEHLTRLKNYITAVGTIAENLKSGAYNTPQDAAKAADEARRQLWPELRGSAPATRPIK